MAQVIEYKPTSYVGNLGFSTWSVTGGTINAVLADASDATYVQSIPGSTVLAKLGMGTVTAPADHEPHRWRAKWRARLISAGSATLHYSASSSSVSTASTPRVIDSTSFTDAATGWLSTTWGGVDSPPQSGAMYATLYVNFNQDTIRVASIAVDIDFRHHPDFTFTPSNTDTRTPTFTRSAVDLDGLTARDWTFRITDLSDNTIWSTSGSGAAPASITVPGGSALANGSYQAKWTIQSTIRGDDPFPHTEVEAFTIAIPTFTGWVIDDAEIVRNNATVYDTRTPSFVFNDLDTASLPVTAWSVDVTGPTAWSDSGTGTPPNPVMVGTPLADGTYQAVMEVTTSGGTTTDTIDFDLEVHAAPSFTPLVIGGPTYTDTNAATLGFGSIDLDGLPVHSWSIVVRENDVSGTIVWTASGGTGSTPPASIVTDLLPNGVYWVAFTITTNFAAAGITLSTTEIADFSIIAPQTVIVTDWSAPRTLPADCVDPEDECSFYYRARLVGTVYGQPAVTDWVIAGEVVGEPVPVTFVEDDVTEQDAVVTLSDGGNTVHITATPPNSDAFGDVLAFEALTGMSARVEIDQTPDESFVYLGFSDATMYYYDGGLYDSADNLLVAYDPVDHAYWRVLTYSGTASFQVSPDGLAWTTIGTLVTAAPTFKSVAAYGATGTDDTMDVTFSEIMAWSLDIVPEYHTLVWTDGEHLLRAMTPDGPVFHSGCGQITWTVSRPFTVANGLAGGRQVSSGAPGGHDISLSLAVSSQEDLESLEEVLERPLVLVSPADSDEQWSAPVSASVQVVKVGRIRTLGAQMIGTGPEPDPEV